MARRPFQFLKFYWQELLLGFVCFFTYVVFEAFQQQFYAENFNNNQPVHLGIMEFVAGSMIRWVVWLLWGMLFIKIMDSGFFQSNRWRFSGVLVYIISIATYIISSIYLACLLVVLRGLSDYDQVRELFEFYFYHKAPILFMFFISIMLFHQWLTEKKNARSRVQELGELRYSNRALYNQIQAQQNQKADDRALILEVKTGRNVHIVQIQDILWLEADDYCMKVHLDGVSHTIRNSLKALQEKLPNNFQRVHRKAIVNLEFVRKLEVGNSPILKLTNSKSVPISQSRMPELKVALSNLAL